MKVNHKFDIADSDRQRIRASIGRRGMSSRSETRIFIERAVRDALTATPEPTVRRHKTVTAPSKIRQLDVLQALPDDTTCTNCARPKVDHGRMGLTCLPTSGRARGERFTV